MPPSTHDSRIRTVEDAYAWLQQVQVCTIMEDRSGKLPSLWDVVDAPDKQPGEGGWGEKMSLVWGWKNALPATYPDDIFYGKIKGGRAILCTMDYLRTLYAQQHRSLEQTSTLAQELYAVIVQGPIPNRPLRQAIGLDTKADKSRFDRAILELQVALLVVRYNDLTLAGTDGLGPDPDRWTTFAAQYPDWQPT